MKHLKGIIAGLAAAMLLAASCNGNGGWGFGNTYEGYTAGSTGAGGGTGSSAASRFCTDPSKPYLFGCNLDQTLGVTVDGYSAQAWLACQNADVSPITGYKCSDATCGVPLCASSLQVALNAATNWAGSPNDVFCAPLDGSSFSLYQALVGWATSAAAICLTPAATCVDDYCGNLGDACNPSGGTPTCCPGMLCNNNNYPPYTLCCVPTGSACVFEDDCCEPANYCAMTDGHGLCTPSN